MTPGAQQELKDGRDLALLMVAVLFIIGVCTGIVEGLAWLIRRFSGRDLAFAFVAMMFAYILETHVSAFFARRRKAKEWLLRHWGGDGWRRRYIKITGNTPPRKI